jgi:hypothetical protein
MSNSIVKNFKRVFSQNGGGGGISGSGTTNYLPKWTPDGFTLGNSQIFDDGTNVGIGTASPTQKLHISGSTLFDKNEDFPIYFGINGDCGNMYQGAGMRMNLRNKGTANIDVFLNSDQSLLSYQNSYVSGSFRHNVQVGFNNFFDDLFTRLFVKGSDSTLNNFAAKFDNSSNTPLLHVRNDGNVGIGTNTPTSKLQVVGLVEYADNAAALVAGLTAGAMYIRTGHGLDIVV